MHCHEGYTDSCRFDYGYIYCEEPNTICNYPNTIYNPSPQPIDCETGSILAEIPWGIDRNRVKYIFSLNTTNIESIKFSTCGLTANMNTYLWLYTSLDTNELSHTAKIVYISCNQHTIRCLKTIVSNVEYWYIV